MHLTTRVLKDALTNEHTNEQEAFSVPNRILERPTKLSKNNPHNLRFLEDIGGLS